MTTQQPERLLLDRLPTPIGDALLVTDEAGLLRGLEFADCEARLARLLRLHYGARRPDPGTAPAAMRQALTAYFAGELAALGGIAWDTGGTSFQRAVWAALTLIPPGTTLSYGGMAARLDRPAAVRAVGAANGVNPLAVVVPCHRLVGADGGLTGYGGGLERKRWLLRHEGALPKARAAS